MNYLYLVDNTCYYLDKGGNIYKLLFTSSTLHFGKIADFSLFLKEMYRYLKKKKIISAFFEKKITCIVNDLYTNVDISTLKDALERLNFKPDFKKEKDILSNINSINYVESNKYYYVVYYNNMYNQQICKFFEKDFFLDKKELFRFII